MKDKINCLFCGAEVNVSGVFDQVSSCPNKKCGAKFSQETDLGAIESYFAGFFGCKAQEIEWKEIKYDVLLECKDQPIEEGIPVFLCFFRKKAKK